MLTARLVVFLLDVDNTLIDNDRFTADLRVRLEQDFGGAGRDRYFALYGERRDKLGYADYLGALQEFRTGLDNDPKLLGISDFLLQYPFAERLYPQALDVVAGLRTLGLPVVYSDGDVVFQPRKIRRSGVSDAVEGRVMICLHKERALPAMQQRYPATHYVMVDDKPLLLAAMKRVLGGDMTTVFVRQGHYAVESAGVAIDPPPDLSVDRIGELLGRDLPFFLAAASVSAMP